MLSSQTKDTMTVAAMDRLLERGFDVQCALDIDVDELAKIIYPVGFWRVRLFHSRMNDPSSSRSISAKHNISKLPVRFYATNTTMTFRTRSKNFALCLVCSRAQ